MYLQFTYLHTYIITCLHMNISINKRTLTYLYSQKYTHRQNKKKTLIVQQQQIISFYMYNNLAIFRCQKESIYNYLLYFHFFCSEVGISKEDLKTFLSQSMTWSRFWFLTFFSWFLTSFLGRKRFFLYFFLNLTFFSWSKACFLSRFH